MGLSMSFDLSKATFYHDDAFPPALDFNTFITPLLTATAAVARYDQILKTMHNSEILLAPLRNQEAVISSRMEGTISTMDEILRYEADTAHNEPHAAHVRSEVVETILYQRALKSAQQGMQDGYALSTSFIKTMHQKLLSLGRGATKSPGQFKTEQNYLADKVRKEVLFVPVSPEKLAHGLERLFAYIHESTHPALVRTAMSHVEFEALHPFQDGNGRIGRMMITLMMWSSGLIAEPHFYISGFLEDHKEEYIDRMRSVSACGDWEQWCVFFLNAVEKQAEKNLATAEKIRTLYAEMKVIFAETLSSKYSVQVLDYIFTNPVFRGNRFSQGSGISKPSSARFLRALTERHLIDTIEESSGRRSALYSFEPLMELVRV